MTNDEIRRYRLDLLVTEFGGVGNLATILDKSSSQVSQWRNASPNSKTGKPRAMNDDTARFIENRTGKRRGWLDTPPDGSPSESESSVFARKAAPPQERNPDVRHALLDLARELERGDLSPDARELLRAELEAKTRYVRNLLSRYLKKDDQ